MASKGNTWFKIKREKLKAYVNLQALGGYSPHADNSPNVDRRDGKAQHHEPRVAAVVPAYDGAMVVKARTVKPRQRRVLGGDGQRTAMRAGGVAFGAWSAASEWELMVRA